MARWFEEYRLDWIAETALVRFGSYRAMFVVAPCLSSSGDWFEDEGECQTGVGRYERRAV